MGEVVRSGERNRMGVGMVKGKVVEGGFRPPPHLIGRYAISGERDVNENNQRTGIFEKLVCGLPRAVELIIDLGAFWKIGVTLA